MKRTVVIPLLISILFLTSIVAYAQSDLIVELGKPELLPKTGFGENVFLPYKIRNSGTEPVTSRFPVKIVHSGAREGIGYPLYLYSGEIKIVGKEPLKKALIEKADGTIYWQDIGTTSIKLDKGIIPAAPAVTLQPGEALLFTDKDIIGSINTFYFQKSEVYTIGYEVDPTKGTNEIKESNDYNNAATLDYNVTVRTFIKGPNAQIGLADNEYWFYFNNVGDCVDLDLPNTTHVCLVSTNSFSTTLSVDGTNITLWHFFKVFGFTKKYNNLEFVFADGFKVMYTSQN